jgi:hypothetical protein
LHTYTKKIISILLSYYRTDSWFHVVGKRSAVAEGYGNPGGEKNPEDHDRRHHVPAPGSNAFLTSAAVLFKNFNVSQRVILNFTPGPQG